MIASGCNPRGCGLQGIETVAESLPPQPGRRAEFLQSPKRDFVTLAESWRPLTKIPLRINCLSKSSNYLLCLYLGFFLFLCPFFRGSYYIFFIFIFYDYRVSPHPVACGALNLKCAAGGGGPRLAVPPGPRFSSTLLCPLPRLFGLLSYSILKSRVRR